MDFAISSHVLASILAIILFATALILHRNGKERAEKVIAMILRLFYLIIIATGAYLVLSVAYISFALIVKILTGIWVIGMYEIVLARTKKKKKTAVAWVLLFISLLLVFYLGYSLPLGQVFF
jgi:uncharacterized membrane protein